MNRVTDPCLMIGSTGSGKTCRLIEIIKDYRRKYKKGGISIVTDCPEEWKYIDSRIQIGDLKEFKKASGKSLSGQLLIIDLGRIEGSLLMDKLISLVCNNKTLGINLFITFKSFEGIHPSLIQNTGSIELFHVDFFDINWAERLFNNSDLIVLATLCQYFENKFSEIRSIKVDLEKNKIHCLESNFFYAANRLAKSRTSHDVSGLSYLAQELNSLAKYHYRY